jgi:hypothetical protein
MLLLRIGTWNVDVPRSSFVKIPSTVKDAVLDAAIHLLKDLKEKEVKPPPKVQKPRGKGRA